MNNMNWNEIKTWCQTQMRIESQNLDELVEEMVITVHLIEENDGHNDYSTATFKVMSDDSEKAIIENFVANEKHIQEYKTTKGIAKRAIKISREINNKDEFLVIDL